MAGSPAFWVLRPAAPIASAIRKGMIRHKELVRRAGHDACIAADGCGGSINGGFPDSGIGVSSTNRGKIGKGDK